MSRGFGGRIVEEVVEAVAFSQRGDCRSGGNTIFWWGTLNLDESMPNRLCLWSLFFPIGDARFFIDRVLIVVAVIPRQGHILYSLWLEGYI